MMKECQPPQNSHFDIPLWQTIFSKAKIILTLTERILANLGWVEAETEELGVSFLFVSMTKYGI